jgi:hypothetical protein
MADRIGVRATVRKCHLTHQLGVLIMDADVSQRVGNADLLAQAQHPVHHAAETGFGQTQVNRQIVHLRQQGGPIGLQYIRQQDGVEQAVMLVVQRAQALRNGVHTTQSSLKRRRAQAGRHQHLLARLQILSVRDDARQVRLDHLHSLHRHCFSHRVPGRRAPGLHAMRQRVGAGCSGQVRRQIQRQVGIQNRDARHHADVQDGAFDLRLLVRDHRRPAHFGACARSGWQRDDRGDAQRVGAQMILADVLEVPQRPGLP